MTERSIFANLTRDDNGLVSAVHGPYLLQTALQPILRETGEGLRELEMVEGLVRASRDGTQIPPAEFFALIDEAERPVVDSLCRSLHILNTGLLGRNDVTLLVNSQPGLFTTPHAIRQEIDRMRLAAHEAGLAPARIACEIRERPDDDQQVVAQFARQLHEAHFRVAIDEYAATDHDLDRLTRLRPDVLKFDPIWVQRFVGNTAGVALMRVIVAQLEREGVRPIVPCVETSVQVELCREIGMPLMQGYLLGRPQIVPTTLDRDFPETPARRLVDPEHLTAADAIRAARSDARSSTPESRSARPVPRFGRRIA